MTAVFASQMQSVFASLVYILPIVSAVISDQWAGRWIMAITSYGGYVPGAMVLAIGAYYKIDWLCLLSYYFLFAIPAAFIKPNLVTLGADQFDARNTEQLRQRGTFFGAQYWVTNIAAAAAFLIMSDVAVSGLGAISQDFGFTFTFIVGTVCLAIGFCVLLGGINLLWSKKPEGSPLGFFFRVTGAAVSGKLDGKLNAGGIGCLTGLLGLFVSVCCAIITYFVEVPWLNYTVAAIIIACLVILIWYGQDSNWVLEAGKKRPGEFTDDEINGVRQVYSLCPYVGFAIPFWAVYNQMYTSFISQGCQMQYGTVAPQTMTTYNSVVIVILIPIFNLLIYPMSQKICGGRFAFTPLRRFGTGLFIAAVAMFAAAMLEYARKAAPIVQVECDLDKVAKFWCTATQIGEQVDQLSICYDYDPLGSNSEPVPVHDINVYYQIFIYGIVGMGEIMTAITIWDDFLPNNLDNGQQDIMYYINMGLALACLFFFIFVSSNFVYKPGTSFYPWDDKDETTLAVLALKKDGEMRHIEGNYSSMSSDEGVVDEIIDAVEVAIEDAIEVAIEAIEEVKR